MSNEVKEGFKEAIMGVIGGIIISALLTAIKSSALLPPSYIALIAVLQVISFVGGIILITQMESWGAGYLIGWLFGIWVMSLSGLVENWLAELYFVVGVVVFIGKIFQKIKEL